MVFKWDGRGDDAVNLDKDIFDNDLFPKWCHEDLLTAPISEGDDCEGDHGDDGDDDDD